MVSGLAVSSLLTVVSLLGAGETVVSPLVEDAQLQEAGMFRYWQAHLPLAPGDKIQEGHLVDEALYVITEGGSLFALTSDTGLIRWAAKLTAAEYKIYRPTHARTADGAGPVVIPTTSEVFIYDRFTGDLRQRFTPEFAAGSAAVAYDDNLFLGSADGRFYSLKLNDPRAREPFKRWTVQAGGPVTAAPLLYDQDMLLFASQNGTVYSCRGANKVLNWVFRTGGSVVGDPTVDGSGAYVASMNRSLYKLNLVSGKAIWRVRLPRPLLEGPVVAAHTVYQYCTGHGLSAFDAHTGREKWREPDGRAFVSHSRSGDVVFTYDRRLVMLDHDTGDPRFTIDAVDVAGIVSNTLDDALYLLGGDGRVLCARLDSVPYLRRQRVLAARAQLNQPPLDDEAAQRLRGSATKPRRPTVSDPLRSRRDSRP